MNKKRIPINRKLKLDKQMMELRTQLLLRNALVSKSGVTLADTEVLVSMARRLGYDVEFLKGLDISRPAVNPYAVMETKQRRKTK